LIIETDFQQGLIDDTCLGTLGDNRNPAYGARTGNDEVAVDNSEFSKLVELRSINVVIPNAKVASDRMLLLIEGWSKLS
jgi:hypothetical protein